MISATTIWRTCPSGFGSFEQPDDRGRKRAYRSRACQQAAHHAGQRHSSAQQHTGRQRRRPGAYPGHHRRLM